MVQSERGQLPDPHIIRHTLSAVVQVVALKKALLGNMSIAWTGSGSVVDPKGIVLTNCHVANPRAMGMPSPPADALAIAITRRSDEPPVFLIPASSPGCASRWHEPAGLHPCLPTKRRLHRSTPRW